MRTVAALGLVLTLAYAAAAIELDESPPEPRTWGFRPHDSAASPVNPPAFTWRPVPGATAYRLQVAQEASFHALSYDVPSTPWSAHCPPRVFKPGRYAWRHAALDESGQATAWSQTRHFEMGPEALAFPRPDLEEMKRRIPQSHPRLFFRPEDVEGLQALAHGRLEEEWAALVHRADSLLRHPPDTTEPPLYPPDTKRKGETWKKIWWGNRKRAIAVTDGAAQLALVYRLTGDEKYGKAAKNLIMAFAEWDPKGATNYHYNDEAAMPLLYYPSRAYTWAHDLFSDAEREKLREVMTIRGRDCFDHLRHSHHLWRPFGSHSNRAWHWLGEVAIAFLGEIEEAETWLDYATTIFFTCYPVWGGNDGGWHEGAAYWASYMSRFMHWVLVSQAALGVDPFDKPFFSQTGWFGLYAFPPGTQLGGFGDQAVLVNSRKMATLMAALAQGSGNPYWQWYAEQHSAAPPGYVGFLMRARAGEIESRSPIDLPASRCFRDTGLAILNTNLLDASQNVQVHFKSSPWGRQSHGYNANNAFLINLHGAAGFIRSGRRDVHGSPHHTGWMWDTRSDNAILVNGEGQRKHAPHAMGHITEFHTGPGLDVVAGEAGAAYPHLDRWTRRLLFFKPHALLIHDVLEAPEAATYQWLLHAKGRFEITGNAAHWQGEKGTLDVQFLVPEALDITQTDVFTPPPHDWANVKLDEWHLTAATQDKAPEMDFLTLITVNESTVHAVVDEEAGARTVQLHLDEEPLATVQLKPDAYRITSATNEVLFEAPTR